MQSLVQSARACGEAGRTDARQAALSHLTLLRLQFSSTPDPPHTTNSTHCLVCKNAY